MKIIALLLASAIILSGCSQASETVEDWYLARQPEYSRVLPTADDCHRNRYVYWEIVGAIQRSNAQFANDTQRLARAIDSASPGYQEAQNTYSQINRTMQENLKQTLLNATGWTEYGAAYCEGRLLTEREPRHCRDIMEAPPESFIYGFYGAAEYCLERVPRPGLRTAGNSAIVGFTTNTVGDTKVPGVGTFLFGC